MGLMGKTKFETEASYLSFLLWNHGVRREHFSLLRIDAQAEVRDKKASVLLVLEV